VSFKPADSPFWWAEYHDAYGKRRRVSTKQRTKREADRVEAELRARVQRQRHGLEVIERNPERLTLAKGAEWCMEHVFAKQAQGAKLAPTLRKHVINDPIGALLLDRVTPEIVTTWMAARASSLSATTVNHLRSYLMSVYTHLHERGLWRGANPVRETKKLPTEEVVPRSLPAHYVLALLLGAPTLEWLLAFAVAAYTGMRRGEIWRVFGVPLWPDVDLAERIITIRKTKRGTVRRVAIHPDLAALLSGLVNHNVTCPSAGTMDNSDRTVTLALKRAGIDDDAATFHGLRGAWATQMMACGASAEIVEFMGWGPRATSVMRRHYVQYPADVLRREIDKLTWPKPPEATR
jgi:integrase